LSAARAAAAVSRATAAVRLEDIIGYCLPYLGIRELSALNGVSRSLGTVASQHSIVALAIDKSTLYPAGPSVKVFETYGATLKSLSVRCAAPSVFFPVTSAHLGLCERTVTSLLSSLFSLLSPLFSVLQLNRVIFPVSSAFPRIVSLCPNLRKLSLTLESCWHHWNKSLAAAGVASLGQLQELRLMWNDDNDPFSGIVCRLHELTHLGKLTLLSTLESDTITITGLVAFLTEPLASRRLIKFKVSTELLLSPGGTDVLLALATHARLEKVTIVRPGGVGAALGAANCALLARAMERSPSLRELHLRRCAMYTEELQALVPAAPCPNIRGLKLDGNFLGFLSGAYFSITMDVLLSRLPRLDTLNLCNNYLTASHATALSASLMKHRVLGLESLTLGSNGIGNAGLEAIAKALPVGLKELYVHGIDCTDAGMAALRDGLDRWPTLWGLGLNGNPVTDSGARLLARALRGRASLRDVGITLSEMTDAGVARLSNALATCPRLRFCYLFNTGFKAANKVTEEAKAKLKKDMPPYAIAIFDGSIANYIKTAD